MERLQQVLPGRSLDLFLWGLGSLIGDVRVLRADGVVVRIYVERVVVLAGMKKAAVPLRGTAARC